MSKMKSFSQKKDQMIKTVILTPGDNFYEKEDTRSKGE